MSKILPALVAQRSNYRAHDNVNHGKNNARPANANQGNHNAVPIDKVQALWYNVSTMGVNDG